MRILGSRCCLSLVVALIFLVPIGFPPPFCSAAKKKPANAGKTSPKPRIVQNSSAASGFSETPMEEQLCRYLGAPYRRGGSGESGFDCSGLTRRMYAELFGLELPHSSLAQSRSGILQTVPLKTGNFETSDLLFFANKNKRINHVGIYLSNGRFLHATQSGGVKVSSLSDRHWKRRLIASRRIKAALLAKAGGYPASRSVEDYGVTAENSIALGYVAALDQRLALQAETFWAGNATVGQTAEIPAIGADPHVMPPPLGLKSWQGVRASADLFITDWLRMSPSLGMIDNTEWDEIDADSPWQVYGLSTTVAPPDTRWSFALSYHSLSNDRFFETFPGISRDDVRMDFGYRLSDDMRFSVMGIWDRENSEDNAASPSRTPLDLFFRLDVTF